MIRNNLFNNVSRETIDKIDKYHVFLIENNKKTSLISKNSEENAYERHYLDSAQIIKYIDHRDRNLLDIGTGAGLPGIILELIKKDFGLNFKVEIIDKSPKKCHFLEKAIRFLDIDIKIHNSDIKMLRNFSYDVLVARAFKPLREFLSIILENSIKFKKIILLKGENYKKEINEALQQFVIKCESHQSMTNSQSKVLVIKSVSKK